jgi:streptogramin lyase
MLNFDSNISFRFSSRFLLPLVALSLLVFPVRVRADLFIATFTNGTVQRYDSTGALVGTFVAAGSGGVNLPDNPIFRPDGNLYVVDALGKAVRRYNGSTGAYIDDLIPAGTGGLGSPITIAFGPDGNLYIAEAAPNAILKYNGATGAYIGIFTNGGNSAARKNCRRIHYRDVHN